MNVLGLDLPAFSKGLSGRHMSCTLSCGLRLHVWTTHVSKSTEGSTPRLGRHISENDDPPAATESWVDQSLEYVWLATELSIRERV